MLVQCAIFLASLVPCAFSRTVAAPCKGFKTDTYEFGKLAYSQPPLENTTVGDRRSLYPNGTVARVECDRGYGTYRSVKHDDVEPNKAVEEERNSTCVNGKWDADLEISPWEDQYNNFVCEPDNPDWLYSLRYREGSGFWGVGSGEFLANDNITDGQLKCYQGEKALPGLLYECGNGAKSCISEHGDYYVTTLRCSNEPCKLDGKTVQTAVCYNTSAISWTEQCCCYGDGCNGIMRRNDFVKKGIAVASPSSCVGWDQSQFKNGRMNYSMGPDGSRTPRDDYGGEDISAVDTYPNGTVARLVCDKGYTSYDVDQEILPSATCIMGGWSGIAPTWGEILFDSCVEKWTEDNGYEYPTLTDGDDTDHYGMGGLPPVPSWVFSKEEEASTPKKSLAESIALRIETFYDKATEPEKAFLKRVVQQLHDHTNV